MGIDNSFLRFIVFWLLLGVLLWLMRDMDSPTPPDKAAAQPKPVSNIDEFNEFINRKKA